MKRFVSFFCVCIFLLCFLFGCISDYEKITIDDDQFFFDGRTYTPYQVNTGIGFNNDTDLKQIGWTWNFYHTKRINVFVSSDDADYNVIFIDGLANSMWISQDFEVPDYFTCNINNIVAWNEIDAHETLLYSDLWSSEEETICLSDVINVSEYISDIDVQLSYGIIMYLSDYPYLCINGLSIFEIDDLFYAQITGNVNDSYEKRYYEVNSQYQEIFSEINFSE